MKIKYIAAIIAILSSITSFASQAKTSSFSKLESPRLDISIIRACDDATCFIDLAKKEFPIEGSLYQKRLSAEMIGRALFNSGQEASALAWLEQNKDINLTKNIIVEYLIGISKGRKKILSSPHYYWDKNDYILPKSLLGHVAVYDIRYAETKALDRDYDEALRAIKGIKNIPSKKGADHITRLSDEAFLTLASIQVDHDLPLKALDTLNLMSEKINKYPIVKMDATRLAIQKFGLKRLEDMAIDHNDSIKIVARLFTLTDYSPQVIQKRLIDPVENKVRQANETFIVQYNSMRAGRSDILLPLLESDLIKSMNNKNFREMIRTLAADGYLELARKVAAKFPNPEKWVTAWSEIGAVSQDRSDFDQAARALEGKCCVEKVEYQTILALNLTRGGFLEDAFAILRTQIPKKKRKQVREQIYSTLLNSGISKEDVPKILAAIKSDIFHKNFFGSGADVLKYTARIIPPNYTTPAILEEMMQLTTNSGEKRFFKKQLISHYAYIGDFETAYSAIASEKHTRDRIKGLTELANFYSYKELH